LNAIAQANPPSAGIDPRTPIEWFQRASDQMNLRTPESAPFHMKVAFHALPGEEMLGPKDKPQIQTGDGTYEETWLAPHHWRREVTFGEYRAVEVESDKGRKIQASSDYEPSRVLMLLSALLFPIPRGLLAVESNSHGATGWSIAHLKSGDLSMVRISDSDTPEGGLTLCSAYYFAPKGLLVAENDRGLSTTWEKDEVFAGKIVPPHITVKASDRDLLTAEVKVEAVDQTDLSAFDLPGKSADPGTTLRPLQGLTGLPRSLNDPPRWEGDRNAAFSFWGVLDRNGRYQELELIFTSDARSIKQFMGDYRKLRFRPAEIDGSRCELPMFIAVVRVEHATFN